MMNFYEMKKYAPAMVRISLALVFLWFSVNQFIYTNNFVSFIPSWLVNATAVSPAVFVILNAVIEFIFGVFLLIGINVRISALVLGLHLLGIAFSLGYSALMIRDLGLALVTLSIVLQGPDNLCIQKN